MKRFVLRALIALALGGLATAQTQVRGYTRSDGTYVAPHVRSSPNSTTSDNYSTRGNVNPYTGEPGTKPDTRPSYGATSSGSSGSSVYTPVTPYTPSSRASSTTAKPPTCTSIFGC